MCVWSRSSDKVLSITCTTARNVHGAELAVMMSEGTSSMCSPPQSAAQPPMPRSRRQTPGLQQLKHGCPRDEGPRPGRRGDWRRAQWRDYFGDKGDCVSCFSQFLQPHIRPPSLPGWCLYSAGGCEEIPDKTPPDRAHARQETRQETR